jgi:hypothetical protein
LVYRIAKLVADPLYTLRVLPANRHIFEVEPRGFKPLTSAVQSQIHIIVDVRRCSEMPAKRPIRLHNASRLFAIVRVGWCTTGVNELWQTLRLLRPDTNCVGATTGSIVSSMFQYPNPCHVVGTLLRATSSRSKSNAWPANRIEQWLLIHSSGWYALISRVPDQSEWRLGRAPAMPLTSSPENRPSGGCVRREQRRHRFWGQRL